MDLHANREARFCKYSFVLQVKSSFGHVDSNWGCSDVSFFLLKSYSFFKNAFLKSSKVKNASKKFIRQHEFFSANPHPNLAAANLNFKISLNQLVVATLVFK